MCPESAIVARVETFIRHPAFDGSDEVMGEVLADLEDKAESGQIGREAFVRLRGLILESPHFRMN